MIASLSLILLCQLAGESFVRGLGRPMPGPVIGLMLLLLLLMARDRFSVPARGPRCRASAIVPMLVALAAGSITAVASVVVLTAGFSARGFAVGIAAHGIGIARAFQVDAVAGVFAGIAMSLNALVTSLLVPLAVTLLLR